MYKENARSNPSLKWQYFGSEFGIINQFPSSRAADCGSYDHRFRYVGWQAVSVDDDGVGESSCKCVRKPVHLLLVDSMQVCLGINDPHNAAQ